jgi:hypothetical protein
LARGGKDKAFGQDGADGLDGGPGNDTLNGGPNPSTGSNAEFLLGGVGDDMLVESAGPDRYLFGPEWGQDQITGDGDLVPADNDDVCFACGTGTFTSGVSINLALGTATEGTNTVTWTPGIIEYATGSAASDTIVDSSRSNVVSGHTGADNINVSGDGGNDIVNCGSDLVVDTVTKDQADQLQGNSCQGDTINNVP